MDTNKVASELIGIAKDLMAAQYRVTVEDMDSKKSGNIEEKSFDDKKDANKFKRQMMKKYKLKNHAGHVVNYSDRKELFTNY